MYSPTPLTKTLTKRVSCSPGMAVVAAAPSCPLAALSAPSNWPATAPAPAHGWVPRGADPPPGDARAHEWRHSETGDTWRGSLRHALPFGEGTYVFANSGLQVQGSVHGDMEHLVFSGRGVMEWPDGSRFGGELHESKFDGCGRFAWANGDIYDGAWRGGQRHGCGTLESWQASLLEVHAVKHGKCAHSMRYKGEWANDLMEGNGVIEYFEAPESTWRQFLHGDQDADVAATHGRLLRRFTGCFKKGFPTIGTLQTEWEDFVEVHFDGATHAGDFATWYWAGSASADARGTALVDLDSTGEEFRAASSRFTASMPAPDLQIAKIQRVQNDDRRAMYDLQRRALEKKVTAPPRSMIWNSRTMERWAFHAPVLPPLLSPSPPPFPLLHLFSRFTLFAFLFAFQASASSFTSFPVPVRNWALPD